MQGGPVAVVAGVDGDFHDLIGRVGLRVDLKLHHSCIALLRCDMKQCITLPLLPERPGLDDLWLELSHVIMWKAGESDMYIYVPVDVCHMIDHLFTYNTEVPSCHRRC